MFDVFDYISGEETEKTVDNHVLFWYIRVYDSCGQKRCISNAKPCKIMYKTIKQKEPADRVWANGYRISNIADEISFSWNNSN